MMSYPFELILVYDGDDPKYLARLSKIYNFDNIITNPGRKRFRMDLFNDAYEIAHGDFYMHLENDFYWGNPNAMHEALLALEKCPDLDFVRMEFLPFNKHHCKERIKLDTDILCVFKKYGEGGPFFQFNFNPHLRREAFPVGEYPKKNTTGMMERPLAEKWNKLEKVAGCLMGENFRHLGIFDNLGHFKPGYINRFTLKDVKTFEPINEFRSFCDNPYYRELFKNYVEGNQK